MDPSKKEGVEKTQEKRKRMIEFDPEDSASVKCAISELMQCRHEDRANDKSFAEEMRRLRIADDRRECVEAARHAAGRFLVFGMMQRFLEYLFETEEKKSHARAIPKPVRVEFDPPATIVHWEDGSKTVVKCGPNETFDKEKGLAMAMAKRACGNRFDYYDQFVEICYGEDPEQTAEKHRDKEFRKGLREARKALKAERLASKLKPEIWIREKECQQKEDTCPCQSCDKVAAEASDIQEKTGNDPHECPEAEPAAAMPAEENEAFKEETAPAGSREDPGSADHIGTEMNHTGSEEQAAQPDGPAQPEAGGMSSEEIAAESGGSETGPDWMDDESGKTAESDRSVTGSADMKETADFVNREEIVITDDPEVGSEKKENTDSAESEEQISEFTFNDAADVQKTDLKENDDTDRTANEGDRETPTFSFPEKETEKTPVNEEPLFGDVQISTN